MSAITRNNPTFTVTGAEPSSKATSWESTARRVATRVVNLFQSIRASFKRNFLDIQQRRYKPEYGCMGPGYDEFHSKAYFCFRDEVLPCIGYAIISLFVIVGKIFEKLGCCDGSDGGEIGWY